MDSGGERPSDLNIILSEFVRQVKEIIKDFIKPGCCNGLSIDTVEVNSGNVSMVSAS